MKEYLENQEKLMTEIKTDLEKNKRDTAGLEDKIEKLHQQIITLNAQTFELLHQIRVE